MPQAGCHATFASTAARRAPLLAFILIVAAGAALRLSQLSLRPMHADEAVHAIKFGTLLEHGHYRYDPNEYHGPTLNYLTLPVAWLTGADRLADVSEVRLRALAALFGILLIILLWPLRQGLGVPATLVAAALTATSPALVFYSRYYIQEMLLAAFSLAAIVALMRATVGACNGATSTAESIAGRPSDISSAGDAASGAAWVSPAEPCERRSVWWFVLLGVSLGLMHASKETCVIAWLAMAAGAAVWAMSVKPHRSAFRDLLPRLLLSAGIAAAVSAVFYSSFFQHPGGVLDSLRAYAGYIQRAGGEGSAGPHDHLWHQYLRWLFWHPDFGRAWGESAIAVLAVPGLIAAVTGRGLDPQRLALARFVTVYSLAMLLIYSALDYKTPWCAVGPLQGLILVAGVGAAALWGWVRSVPGRLAMIVLLIAAVGDLGWQSRVASFTACADRRNPYVYAHTTADVPALARRIERIAACHPDGMNLHLQVVCPHDDHWPLPWYLRAFTRVAWYGEPPDGPPAPLIISQPSMEPQILQYLYVRQPPGQRALYMPLDQPGERPAELRPNVPLRVYLRLDLWEAYRAQVAGQRPAQGV